MSRGSPSVPTRLRYEWAGVTALAAAGVVVGALFLTERWTATQGRIWLATAGTVVVAESLLIRRWLDDNRPSDAASLRPTLGLANGVTALRGLLVAAIAGFLPLTRPFGAGLWVPAALYGAAIALDYLDGYLARELGEVTQLGERLDEAMDAAGLFIAPTLAILHGQLPVWYLVVPLAKPLYVASLWVWRYSSGGELRPLPESAVRQYLAALQMVITAVALAPPVGPPATTALAAVGAVPFAATFVRDWLTVAGIRR